MDETKESLPTGPTGETVAAAPLAGSLLTRPATAAYGQTMVERTNPTVTLGHQVLYLQHEGVFHTALVCKVLECEAVNLKVTDDNGDTYVVRSVSKGSDVGEWSFPPRV